MSTYNATAADVDRALVRRPYERDQVALQAEADRLVSDLATFTADRDRLVAELDGLGSLALPDVSTRRVVPVTVLVVGLCAAVAGAVVFGAPSGAVAQDVRPSAALASAIVTGIAAVLAGWAVSRAVVPDQPRGWWAAVAVLAAGAGGGAFAAQRWWVGGLAAAIAALVGGWFVAGLANRRHRHTIALTEQRRAVEQRCEHTRDLLERLKARIPSAVYEVQRTA